MPDLDLLSSSLPLGNPSGWYIPKLSGPSVGPPISSLGCGFISKNNAGLVVLIPTALVPIPTTIP